MILREKDIQAHIKDLEIAIHRLQAEKRALENLLVKEVAKAAAGAIKDKRSYMRIYNEEKIRQQLRRYKDGALFKELATSLRRAGVSIKDPTLRSYLTRMSIRGELSHSLETKRWSLTY